MQQPQWPCPVLAVRVFLRIGLEVSLWPLARREYVKAVIILLTVRKALSVTVYLLGKHGIFPEWGGGLNAVSFFVYAIPCIMVLTRRCQCRTNLGYIVMMIVFTMVTRHYFEVFSDAPLISFPHYLLQALLFALFYFLPERNTLPPAMVKAPPLDFGTAPAAGKDGEKKPENPCQP